MPIPRRRSAVAPRSRSCGDAVETLRACHPALLISAREDARSITLDRLLVPSDSRGRGLGSAFMCDLVAYADRCGKQIRLTPSGAFGASPRRLAAFYRRFGFVPNEGIQRDPACRERMYRDPAAAPPRTPGA
jgi:GNAT superfamily N-acetyltransferase